MSSPDETVIPVLPVGCQPLELSQGVLFSNEFLKVMRLVLPAGKAVPPHTAPGDITVHCLHGQVDFQIGDHIHRLKTGELLVVANRVRHGLTAVDDSIVLVTIALHSP